MGKKEEIGTGVRGAGKGPKWEKVLNGTRAKIAPVASLNYGFIEYATIIRND